MPNTIAEKYKSYNIIFSFNTNYFNSLAYIQSSINQISNISIGRNEILSGDKLNALATSVSGLSEKNALLTLSSKKLTAAQKEQILTSAGIIATENGISESYTRQILASTSLNEAQVKEILSKLKLTEANGAQSIALATYTKSQLTEMLATQGLSKAQIEAAFSTIGFTSAVDAQVISFNLLTKSILTSVAAFGKWLVTSPAGIFILAATAIQGVIKVHEYFNTLLEKTQEELASSNEEFKTASENVDKLKSELEDCKTKLDALNALGGTNVTSTEELENLQKQTRELEVQLALAREKARLTAQSALDDARDSYGTAPKYKYQNSSNYGYIEAPYYKSTNTPEGAMQNAIDAYDEFYNKYRNIQEQIIEIGRNGGDVSGLENKLNLYESQMKEAEAYANEMYNFIIQQKTAIENAQSVGIVLNSQDKSVLESSNLAENTYEQFISSVERNNQIIIKHSDMYNKISEALDEAKKGLQEEYNKISSDDFNLDEYAEDIKNGTLQTVFGNVDMDKRVILEWSDELKKTYKDALTSWDYNPQIGSVDTIYGTSDRFGENLNGKGWEIAFTPITPDGKFLSKDTVYDYIESILEEAFADDGKVTSEELAEIDAKGRQIGDTFVQGIFAAIDDNENYDNNSNWADVVARLMHFSGSYGAPGLMKQQISNIQLGKLPDKKLSFTPETPSFNIADEETSKSIDDYQKKISDLGDALDKLKNHKLTNSDLLDLKQEFPTLITETDNLDQALKNLIDNSLSDMIKTLSKSGAPDSLISGLQKIADEAKGLGSADWTNTLKVFDDADAKMTSLGQLINQLGNDYTLTAAEARKFADVFPELLSLGKVTSDGLIQYNKDVIDDFVSGKESQIKVDRDAQISQLESEKTILVGKRDAAQAALDLVAAQANGEIDGENQKNAQIAQARDNLVQHLIDLGVSETDADAVAKEIMAGNTTEYDRVVGSVAENVDRNLSDSIHEAAGNVNTSSRSMIDSLFGVGQQAVKTAKSILSIGSNNPFDAAKEGLDGITGIQKNFALADPAAEFKKKIQEQLTVEGYKPVDASVKLQLDIDSYNSAIASIDSQINLLKASANKSLGDYVKETKDKGSKGSKDKKETEEEIDWYAQKLELLKEKKELIADMASSSTIAYLGLDSSDLEKANSIIEKLDNGIAIADEDFNELASMATKAGTNIDDFLDKVRNGEKIGKSGFLSTGLELDRAIIELSQEAMDAYYAKYQEVAKKINEETRQKIENGDSSISTYTGDNAENVKEAKKWFDTYRSQKQELEEAKKTLHDSTVSYYENELSYLDQLSEKEKHQNDLINKQIDYLNTCGQLVNASTYETLIANLQAQETFLEQKIAKKQAEMKAMLELGSLNGGWDTDSEEYFEAQQYLDDLESSIIDLEEQQAEYNDTLRQLPVNNLQKLVDMYDDISTALDNQKNELEAAGKVVSKDYYQAQISNGEHTIRQLERQREAVEDVMDEYEVGSDKWIEMNSKLNEIDSSISSINVNISEWNDAIAQIPINNIQKILDLYNNVTSAIDNMKSEIESSGGLVPEDYYKAQIENGQEIISQLKEQRTAVEDVISGYEVGSDKWNDMYSQLSDIDSSISSVTTNINEWTDAMRQIPLNNLEKVVDVYNSITTALDNYKNESESAGRIVSNDYYKNQIANGNKIISQLKDEKKIIEGIIGFYEVGSDKWTDLNSKLNDVNSSISSITSNINEWNETLKQIPLNNIQKVVDSYNDIKSTLDNQKSLYESSGEVIGAGYYQEQIKNGQNIITQLNEQKKIVQDLMNTYETGSDKWIEMNSKLNDIDSSIVSITGNIAEWNDSLKQLPVNNVQKLIDLYNQFSSVLENRKNEMDSIGTTVSADYYKAQINNGEQVLEQLQKQREYIENILSTYEVGSDKWIEMNSKLNDLDSSISSATVNLNTWKENLAQLPINNLQKVIDLYNQFSSTLDNKKNELDSAGIIISEDYYQAQIKNGQSVIEQLNAQKKVVEDLLSSYEVGTDKWTEMNSKLEDINSSISSTTVNINQWKEALAQLPINNLQKIVDLYSNLSSAMDNRKNNIESSGGVVSTDYYKYQIENAQKNIEYLQKQREAVEKLMSSYETGSDKWVEMNSQLNNIDSTISGLVDNINNWSDTLRRLPLDNIEKLLDILNNISTALDNRKNEVESAGGIVSADYYQALIQNGQNTLAQLEKQKTAVKETMSAYEEGSDKWIEMNSKLVDIDSSISSIVVNTNEWKDALRQLPITNLQKVVDMYDKLSTKIQNWGSQIEASGATLDKDYYQALINNGQSTIDQLQKQAEAIKNAMNQYEVGSEKWTDMFNQLQDIDSSISSIVNNMHQWNQSILQLPLDRLDSLINDLQSVKDALDEVENEHSTVITAVTNAIQKQKDDLQDAADEQLDALNKQKEALQDQLDLLQDQNEALKRQREYEQALKDLEDAKRQRTNRVIRNGQVVYEADQDAITDAEQKVQDAKDALEQQKIQDKIDDIDDSIDDINDVLEEQLKALTKIYDKWNTITEEREAYTNGNVANKYLGEDWLNKVLTGTDDEIYQAFKDLYNQNEDTKDQYEQQIDSSQKIQNLINTYITAYRSGNITRDQAMTGIKSVLNSLNHEMTAGENVQHILNFLSTQNNTGATTNDILTDTQNKMMDTAGQIQNSLDIYEKNSNTIVDYMSTFGQLTQDIADIHVTIDSVQAALNNHTATMEGDFTKLQESMNSGVTSLDTTLKNNANKSDKNFADLNSNTNLVKDSIEKNTSKAESGFSEIGSKLDSNMEALKENTSKTDSGFTNLGTKLDNNANTLKTALDSSASKTDQGFANLGTKLDSNANTLKTALDNNTTKTDSGFASINNTMNSTANSLKTSLDNNAGKTDITNLKNTLHSDISNVNNTLNSNANKSDKSFSNLQDRMSDSIKEARKSIESTLDDGFDDVVSALGKYRNSQEEKNYDEDKESSTSTRHNTVDAPNGWQSSEKFDGGNGKEGYEVGWTKRYADGIEEGVIGGSEKEKYMAIKELATTDLEKDEHPIIAHTGEVVLNKDQQKQVLSNFANITPDMIVADTQFDYETLGKQLTNSLKKDGLFKFDWIKQQNASAPNVTQNSSVVNFNMGDIVLQEVQTPDEFAKAFKSELPMAFDQVFARR